MYTPPSWVKEASFALVANDTGAIFYRGFGYDSIPHYRKRFYDEESRGGTRTASVVVMAHKHEAEADIIARWKAERDSLPKLPDLPVMNIDILTGEACGFSFVPDPRQGHCDAWTAGRNDAERAVPVTPATLGQGGAIHSNPDLQLYAVVSNTGTVYARGMKLRDAEHECRKAVDKHLDACIVPEFVSFCDESLLLQRLRAGLTMARYTGETFALIGVESGKVYGRKRSASDCWHDTQDEYKPHDRKEDVVIVSDPQECKTPNDELRTQWLQGQLTPLTFEGDRHSKLAATAAKKPKRNSRKPAPLPPPNPLAFILG